MHLAFGAFYNEMDLHCIGFWPLAFPVNYTVSDLWQGTIYLVIAALDADFILA